MATESCRSKVKAYERQKSLLSDVAIEMSCQSEPRISGIAEEIEKKLTEMDNMLKIYKKLAFMAELELKKQETTKFRKRIGIFQVLYRPSTARLA